MAYLPEAVGAWFERLHWQEKVVIVVALPLGLIHELILKVDTSLTVKHPICELSLIAIVGVIKSQHPLPIGKIVSPDPVVLPVHVVQILLAGTFFIDIFALPLVVKILLQLAILLRDDAYLHHDHGLVLPVHDSVAVALLICVLSFVGHQLVVVLHLVPVIFQR